MDGSSRSDELHNLHRTEEAVRELRKAIKESLGSGSNVRSVSVRLPVRRQRLGNVRLICELEP